MYINLDSSDNNIAEDRSEDNFVDNIAAYKGRQDGKETAVPTADLSKTTIVKNPYSLKSEIDQDFTLN
jgi:hypothetical protein